MFAGFNVLMRLKHSLRAAFTVVAQHYQQSNVQYNSV
jgi:hypothetical protein